MSDTYVGRYASQLSQTKEAEKQRRRDLEAGFNNITETRQQRIRALREIIDEYLDESLARDTFNRETDELRAQDH
jgi:hypothetical protein